MSDLIITPKTKVSELLNHYPDLEKTLIKYTPAFTKLKNPVLRKTIAKFTTLQQASAIAGIKVEELVNALRNEAGLETLQFREDTGYIYHKPDWFDKSRIEGHLDAREMLDAGEHPVNQVMAELQGLKVGDIYELKAPFLPAPLIDKAASIRFYHWVVKESETAYIIYFCKPD